MTSARYGKRSDPTYKLLAKVRNALVQPPAKRGDGRNHDTGLIRPYRPVPSDFVETYVLIGWDGLDEFYNTNWRVIRRWVALSGQEKLRAARAAYVAEQRRIRREKRGVRC